LYITGETLSNEIHIRKRTGRKKEIERRRRSLSSSSIAATAAYFIQTIQHPVKTIMETEWKLKERGSTVAEAIKEERNENNITHLVQCNAPLLLLSHPDLGLYFSFTPVK
jgi:hypothetical protein